MINCCYANCEGKCMCSTVTYVLVFLDGSLIIIKWVAFQCFECVVAQFLLQDL